VWRGDQAILGNELNFCSVIIPTIGRATLGRAVESVLAQDCGPAGLEVIVVNDSGRPLPDAEWHDAGCVRLISTNRRERSVARNTGAALAKGNYLCFLDDDDWLVPGALQVLRLLAQTAPRAAWLYGGIRIVDENGNTIGEVNSGLNGNCLMQILGGAWAPIQASLIRSSVFFESGGFDPSICGTEDLDLCRRVALRADFANTAATVACLQRGKGWHTSTNYQRAPADTRRSRDSVLDEPGVTQRLRQSSRSAARPAYWYGRLLRVYLSTVRMNLSQLRLFTALSRAMFGALVCVWAGWRVFSRSFWDGVRAEHAPDTLHFIIQAYERDRPATIARITRFAPHGQSDDQGEGNV
jgi:glycosyltransferase involved in cell wall biosynthesis